MIKNKSYAITINEECGSISALSFEGKEYLKHELPIFTAAFRKSNGDLWTMNSAQMKYSGKKEDEYLYDSDCFSAFVKILTGDEIQISVSIKNKGNDAVEYIETAICVDKELGKNKILWGFNEGVVVDNFKQREKCLGFLEPKYPGMGFMPLFPAVIETQFMAYYDEETGLYMGAHDAGGNLKAIDFIPYKTGIKMYFRFYTGADFGADYKMEFPWVLKPYKGGWHEAADIYREWFSANTDFVPINENKQLPEWYKESPVVVTYPVRGLHDTDTMTPTKLFPYITGLSQIEKISEAIDSKILVLLMHWEGTAPWAPPYVWPPYGGEKAFKEYVKALHEKGHLIGVYCSGMGYTMKSKLIDDYECSKDFEEKNLAKIMCRSPKEELLKSEICTMQLEGYDMCPTQKFTSDVLIDQTKKMISSGVDYIQLMDQNHGGNSYFCYSKKHGHSPVPGKWQIDAVKKILSAASSGSNVLLGCESAAGETFIPNLLFSDNRFNCAYSIGEPVPMYAYIYHEYVNNFMGNQVCMDGTFDYEKNPENLLMRMAYSFCAGDMMTIIITDSGKIVWNWGLRNFEVLPDNKKILEFTRQANGFRKREGKYLNSGKMLKPTDLKLGKNEIIEKSGFKLHVDKLIQSKWLAYDGTWAEFLANYNDYDIDVQYPAGQPCKVIMGDSGLQSDNMNFTVKAGSIVMVKQI